MKIPALTSFTVLSVITLAGFFSGCATTVDHAEFVKSINFSNLDTFSYKHTLVTGMDWRDSEEIVVEDLSERVLCAELIERGFEQVDAKADFYVVAKWRKSISSYPGTFDHIDGPYESLNDRHKPSFRAAVRHTLILEIYESDTNNLFWRNDLPNIFDATQFTEERIKASLVRAIKNFPAHIEKDPNLPSIQ